jgi:Alr-MurF fusion protein
MKYSSKEIAELCQAQYHGTLNHTAEYLLTDSRSLIHPNKSIFFAISGLNHDGHHFIESLYKSGVRIFIISKKQSQYFPDADYIIVQNTIKALQCIAANYRKQFKIPVIGITGSNGKTIVKEWLNQILSSRNSVIRSPKSYNSQIGVPLSVNLLNKSHKIAIFEAGISQPDEMEQLGQIILPTIGILTNIGNAHQENFQSIQEKLIEKLKLFSTCQTIILPIEIPEIRSIWDKLFPNSKAKILTWGKDSCADYIYYFQDTPNGKTNITITNKSEQSYYYEIPFSDSASIKDSVIVFITAIEIGLSVREIIALMPKLEPVSMRMEVREAINDCVLINDTYNSDVNSLRIALDFAKKQPNELVVILSDIVQSGKDEVHLYQSVAEMISPLKLFQFIGIGEQLSNHRHFFDKTNLFYQNTADFIESHSWLDFHHKTILLKAARKFHFEDIARRLELKAHQTSLEIHLDAISKNLAYFRNKIPSETLIMVMVKAFSYGSGYIEIAKHLQHQSVDYLGVAFADEGADLRKAEIHLPIGVMNPQFESYDLLLDYHLEPEIYSLNQLKEFIAYLKFKGINDFPVHLKIDTGMHRLGIMEHEIPDCIEILRNSSEIYLKSIFSHLAASDTPHLDDFTTKQLNSLLTHSNEISSSLNIKPILHIANTHAIIRHPQTHLDMVRLGIGLYGLSKSEQKHLIPASEFKTRILSIKSIVKGESVGYNLNGITQKDSTIAIIPIGYADGLNRKLGNGNWKVNIGGKLYPTIGDICMDMCQIDITDANVKINPGDEVVIFGDYPTVNDMANVLGTIVYEILTHIPPRVKRIYTENS